MQQFALVRFEVSLLPHDYDLLWGLVSFTVIAILLGKFAVPKFMKILDERTAKIEGGLEAAKLAQEQMELERGKLNKELVEARKQAVEIREKAHKDATLEAQKIQSEAEKEAQRVVSGAVKQIENEKLAAKQSIKSDLGALALELAEKILGEEAADKNLQARVIDRYLDQLEVQAETNLDNNNGGLR